MDIPLSCAGVAVEDGKVFAARRKTAGEMAGRWEFPGGKVEEGERPEAALVREFEEELGIAVECGEKLAECEFTHKGRKRRLAAYRVRLPPSAYALREHSECRWVTPRDALELDWTPSDYAILRKLVRADGSIWGAEKTTV